MRRTSVVSISAVGALTAVSLAAPRAVAAQEAHAATPEELEALVVRRTEAVDADREALRAVLQRPEVRRVARTAGLDIRRAESAVAVLDAEEVERLAPTVRQVEEALAGGANVVIPITTLIIALLILIIILVI